MNKEIINTNMVIEETNLTPIEVMLGVNDKGEVSARNLYKFLELNPTNYSRWAKQNIVENLFAEEDVDFSRIVLYDERNPKPTTDYILTASFAKKLAMGTNNKRGEQAKNYFIKVEEKLKEQVIKNNLPQTKLEWMEFAINLEKERIRLEQEKLEKEKIIELQAPKVETADKFFSSEDVFSMQNASKLINEKIRDNKKIGEKKLYKILRDEGVLQTDVYFGWDGKKKSGKDHNIPYQKYIDQDYFILKSSKWQDKNNNTHINLTTMVTTRGVDFIWRLLKRKGYVVDNSLIA